MQDPKRIVTRGGESDVQPSSQSQKFRCPMIDQQDAGKIIVLVENSRVRVR